MKRILQKKSIIVCCLVLVNFLSLALAQEKPGLKINSFQEAPKLDGELNESCWQNQKGISNFYLYKGGGRTVQYTEAKLGYDNKWLYVGLTCQNPHMGITEQKAFKHDSDVHRDDSVELFIDPGTGGKLYFHFKLNHADVRAEQRVLKQGKLYDSPWMTAWCSATKQTKDGWSAEIAIPLFILAANGDLSKAKINICRNKIVSIIDMYDAKIREKTESSSSFPVVKRFHEPHNFGRLKGLEDIKIEEPFIVGFENARVNPYQQDGDKFSYSISLDVRSYNQIKGKVKVNIIDKSKDGQEKEYSEIIAFEGRDKKSTTINVPVSLFEERRVTISLEDENTEMVLQKEEINTDILKPMEVYLDRSYYTSEKQAFAVCEIRIPEETLKNTTLAVTDKEGMLLGKTTDISAETKLAFDVSGLSDGEHIVTLNLRNKAGKTMFCKELALRKLPPNPGNEWKVDQIKRVVLHDNKPYFPIGIINNFLWDEKGLKLLKEMNFNSLMEWETRLKTDSCKKHAESASKYGFTYMGNVDGLFSVKELENPDGLLNSEQYEEVKKLSKKFWRLTSAKRLVSLKIPTFIKGKLFLQYCEKNLDDIAAAMKSARNIPYFWGWFMLDEPMGDASVPMMEAANLLRRKLHEVDGYKLIYANYASYIPRGDKYIEWADIISSSSYWVPGGNHPEYANINWFVTKIARTEKRAKKFRRVNMCVPACSHWSGSIKRTLLPEEHFCQAYLALIHGARGIYYFIAGGIHAESTVKALTGVNHQLQRLAPMVLTKEIDQEIEYQPTAFNLAKKTFPAVQVLLTKNPSDGYVLLAANTCYYPVEVRYTIDGLEKKGKVKRLFAEKEYIITDGSFKEKIEGYGTRAYLILKVRLKEPVNIAVTTVQSYEDEVEKEKTEPLKWRKGKKNIFFNPSFEDAVVPGWPDYYKAWYADPLIGSTNAGWGQDTNDPIDGKYCLKVNFIKGKRTVNGFMTPCLPQHDKPTEYVFSAYLKGQPGRKVLLTGEGGPGIVEHKSIKLTASWKRYHTKVIIPAKDVSPSGFWFAIYSTSGKDGTMWIDAIQLEEGSVPTAFEK